MKKKYTYPIITTDNFDKATENIIGYKKIKARGSYNTYPYLKIKAPKSRNDFYNMTQNMFGCGLELGDSAFRPGIVAPTGFKESPLSKLWDKKHNEGWRIIGYTAFGNMGTGGWDHGSYDYGFKYREKKRIKKMFKSKLHIRKSNGSNQT